MMDATRRARLREILRLTWPAMLHGLVTTIVFFTDRLLLGRYALEALAATAICGPLIWSVYAIASSWSSGLVAWVGRATGAGDAVQANATLRAGVWLGLGCGLLVGLVGFAGAAWASDLLSSTERTSDAVRAMATSYQRIVFAAAPFHLVAVAAMTSLQASGDTRTPMLAALLAGSSNLFVSWVLIWGHFGLPSLGLRGAAIGTAVAFVLEAAFVIAALVRVRVGTALTLRGRVLGHDLQRQLRRVLRISAATLGERTLYHAAYVAFAALVAHLGDVAMAAHQALIAIEAISFTAAEAFGVAAGALVSQKMGAGRPAAAKEAGMDAAWLGGALLVGVGLVFACAGEPLVRIFSDDPDVVRKGALCLLVAAVAQPLMALTDAWAGALRGAGDTRTPMMAALAGPVVVRLVACWVFAYPLGLGLVGIWIGSTLDWGLRAVWLGRAFARGRWQTSTPRD